MWDGAHDTGRLDLDRALRQLRDLPAGVSQCDCDGRFDPLANATAAQLWHACPPRIRETIAQRFAQTRPEEVRDALLDAQESALGMNELGRLLWQNWIDYRDRVLEELHRRGGFG